MATATMGQSSVDRLARSKRPTVERAEIHIPPAPVFPLEAVTGAHASRARAVSHFNNALQKWRNDAWSIEAPFVPDAALQADVATLGDNTAKMSTKLDRAAIDINTVEESVTTIQTTITNIDNGITTINNQITNINNAITGTGIVQANGANPPTAITGSTGHFPFWQPTAPYLSPTSSIFTSAGMIGIGTVAPTTALHATITDTAGTAISDVFTVEHKVAAFMGVNGGTGVKWVGASDSVIGREMGRIQTVWTVAADATRTSAMEWQTVSGGTTATRMALSGAGGLSVGNASNTMPVGVINAATGFRVNNIATSGQVLMGDGTNIILQALPVSTHTILDAAVHTDSVTQTVTRGSLIYGNATPKWDELVIGAAGTVLSSDGTDVSWQTPVATGHAILSVTHTDSVVNAVTRGSLIYGNATPAWDELVIGAGNRLLRSDGTDVSWAQAALATDVTGILLIANGGTNSGSFNTNSVIFYNGSSLTDDGSSFTYGAAGDNQLIIARAMGAVSSNSIGLALLNTSAAALGAQQWSPPLIFEGQGWDSGGSTSQSVLYRNYVVPVQAATNPTGYWILERSINNAAFVELLRADSTGFLRVLKDDIRITQGAFGLHVTNSTPATSSSTLQQWSPPIIWEGQGWKTNATAASQRVQFRNYVAPVIGAAAPTAYFVTDYDINATGTFTEVLRVDSSGFLRITKDALGSIDTTLAQSVFGLHLWNNTAATAGVTTQDAPPILFKGSARNTTASTSHDWRWRMLMKGVTNAGATRSYLRIDSGADASNFGNPVVFSSAGGLSVGALIEAAFGVVSSQVGYQIAGGATAGQFLRGNGTNFVSSAIQAGDISAAAMVHAMLSATHSDTLASAVSRGSLIVGNATPLWAELNIGAANRLLRSDGTDASWAQAALTTDVTGVLPIANGGTNAALFAVAGVVYYDGTRLINASTLIYDGVAELDSMGVSLNGINEVYMATNVNTGASAGTGYQASLSDTSNNRITAGRITWVKEQSWTTTASTQDCLAEIATTLDGILASALTMRSSGSIICGKDSTGTTRTDDFTYICTTNGVPTGVPTTFGSRVPITFDPNTDTLYVYRGGWKGVVLT